MGPSTGRRGQSTPGGRKGGGRKGGRTRKRRPAPPGTRAGRVCERRADWERVCLWRADSLRGQRSEVIADLFQKRPARSKNSRLWKKTPDSGNSWPTLETAGRLWKQMTDSGNSDCVCLPKWNKSAAVFSAFRNAFRSVGGECNAMNRPRFSARFETRSGPWGVSPARKGGRFSARFETRSARWACGGV